MELLVCVKQVPDDSVTVTLDASGKPNLGGITPVVNAFDTYALEMATRFKEANGGNVSVITVGDLKENEKSLRSCLSVGASTAITVSAGDADAACALACGIPAAGTYDVIFCGSESTDVSAAQTGIRLAAALNLPVVTNVLALEPADGGLTVKQETEEGYRTVSVPTPCVLTIVKPAYDPRYPTMKSKMAARKIPISTVTVDAPAASDAAKCVKISAPAQRQAGVKIQEKEAADAVAKAMGMLIDRKLV